MEILAEENQDEVVLEDTELGDESNKESEELEIVLEGEEATSQEAQPAPKGFRRRINKLNNRNKATEAELEQERRKNQLLQLQIQQQQKPDRRPRLEDFDHDEEQFAAALDKWDEARLERVASKFQPAPVEQKPDNSALESHYDRAEKLSVSDYEATEDVVIDAIGDGVLKEITEIYPKSEQLVYFLGKNPRELGEVQTLLEEGKGKLALSKLGEIYGRMRVVPKNKSTPKAETQVSGDSAPVSATEWNKRIKQMRDSGKYSTKQIIAEKQRAKAAGVHVE